MTDLEQLVLQRHDLPAWALVFELANGTGAAARGRIDAAAFSCWPSKGFERIAYEIKRSRRDFVREIEAPDKRRWVEQWFHRCYFVCERDVCAKDEVPQGWGLLVPTKKGDKLRQVKVAQAREPDEPPIWFWASVVRSLNHELDRHRTRTIVVDGRELSWLGFVRLVEEHSGLARKWAEEARRKLSEERHALERDRRELAAPLAALQSKIGVRGFPRRLPEGLTAYDVHDWIEKVYQQAAARVLEQIVGVQRTLEQLERAARTAENGHSRQDANAEKNTTISQE